MRSLFLALTLTVLALPASALSESAPQMVDRLKQGLDPATIHAALEPYALPIYQDPRGNLVIRLESNLAGKAPTLAFFARLGKGPLVVHPSYDGKDLRLPWERITLRGNPALEDYLGSDILTTDGKHPLAGVEAVELFTALQTILQHPEWKHGDVLFVFQKGDLAPATLGADWAYTLDAGKRGAFGNHSFQASSVHVSIFAPSGYGKGKFVNSIPIAADFVQRVPSSLTPENPNGGFIHPAFLKAEPAKADLSFQLRDVDHRGLTRKESLLREIAIGVQKRYPKVKMTLKPLPVYQDLKTALAKEPRVSRAALNAYRKLGLAPSFQFFRNEPDCLRYSSQGLPTGALFSGIENHGTGGEWLPVTAMTLATDVIVEICRNPH